MNAGQLQMFAIRHQRLEDVPLERRLAAVERLIKDDPDMGEEERWALFGLVVCPQVFGTVER